MKNRSHDLGTSAVHPAAALLNFDASTAAVRRRRWAGWPAWTTVPVEMLELDAFDADGNPITNPLIIERGQ